jgi:DNA polymerase I-like protein with 3'-5' exonuclease and polymerase domains
MATQLDKNQPTKRQFSDLTSYLKKLPHFLQDPNPEIFLSNNYVVLDFETTVLDKGDPNNPSNSIVLGVWRLGKDHPSMELRGDKNLYIIGSEYKFNQLVEDIQDADFVVAHNSKFELGWLRRCGCDLHNTLSWCTQVGEYVIAGNRKFELSLSASLKRHGLAGKDDLVGKMIKNGADVLDIPVKWLLKYCAIDVIRDEQLFLLQRQKIIELGLLPTQFTRCLFTSVLADVERHGMHLDAERVPVVYKKFNDELVSVKREMEELLGNINMSSPKQKVEAIYGTLGFAIPKDWKGNPIVSDKTEQPSTDADTLGRLVPKTAKQRKFLALAKRISKLGAAVSKSLGKFNRCVEETEDHILTAALNQTITQTQRLSSSGKNYKAQFQNFAREFKPLMNARYNGWSIGEADEAQLEYRVAVFLGQDQVGLQDILNKVDAHGFTASIIFKEIWEACGGNKKTAEGAEARQQSKSHTFKPLYGGRSGTDREREYYEAFRNKHKGITAAQDRWIDEVLKTKELVTMTGLRFYWPDTKVTRSGYIVNTTSICNYPVQSFATADIVPIGMVYQWHLMHVAELESFLVNTIHDSTIGEVHPEEHEIYEEIANYSLTDAVIVFLKKVYNIDFNVPLEAEIKISKNWSDDERWREEYLK